MLAYAGYRIEEDISTSGNPGREKKITKIGDQGNLEFTQVKNQQFFNQKIPNFSKYLLETKIRNHL